MKDIIYEFLDYISLEKKYLDYTETNYADDLYKYSEYLKNYHLNYLNIKYKDLSDFVIYLKKCGYKSSTINRILSTLRSFYNYLVYSKKIAFNPLELVSSLKTEKRLPNYFKYDEFLKMLDSLKGDEPLTIRNRLILEMLLATGARVSELSNMKLIDFNLENREVRIIGKGQKERIVFYGSYCEKSLNNYLNNARKYLLDGKTSDYLFINNNGTKLTDRGIRLIISKIIETSSITSKVSPHTFRHTFATIMLNEGCDIRSVQELLGHSSLSTTSIYTHLTNEQIRNVYLHTHPRAKK